MLAIIPYGYLLEFKELSPIGRIRSMTYSPALESEVSLLLQKQAIQQVLSQDILNNFYFRYFTVPKRDGSLHPILDLRLLNTCIHPRRFHMVTLESVISLLSPGD